MKLVQSICPSYHAYSSREIQCQDGADLDHACVDAVTQDPNRTPTVPFCMATLLQPTNLLHSGVGQ